MRTRLIWLLALAACGGTDGDTTPGTPDAAPAGVTSTFSSLYGDYFQQCKSCHTPGAPGRAADTEMTLDFTSKSTAYMTITMGMASNLMGNAMDCNMVPFVNHDMPSQSLILASLDQPTRNAFDDPAHAGCDMDTITDQTLKVGSPPSAAFIAALKDWLAAGTPNN